VAVVESFEKLPEEVASLGLRKWAGLLNIVKELTSFG
jgi:hypothetical protein